MDTENKNGDFPGAPGSPERLAWLARNSYDWERARSRRPERVKTLEEIKAARALAAAERARLREAEGGGFNLRRADIEQILMLQIWLEEREAERQRVAAKRAERRKARATMSPLERAAAKREQTRARVAAWRAAGGNSSALSDVKQ